MIMVINLFIPPILKIAFKWNTSDSPTHYVQELLEWLQIILLLENIGSGFFLCSCGDYLIETRTYILYRYIQYRRSWNSKRKISCRYYYFSWVQSRSILLSRRHYIGLVSKLIILFGIVLYYPKYFFFFFFVI